MQSSRMKAVLPGQRSRISTGNWKTGKLFLPKGNLTSHISATRAGLQHALGNFGKEPVHLRARFEVKFVRVEAHAFFIGDFGAGLDAEEGVVGRPVSWR